ncbi:diguanylate cyclase domain-containing protein [Silvibacterium sp.]|uniref:diguanylate cyclase domain-containing protein n=1 Tax=Silvibacterium sp. TaxID=1964179 RepID=UPI0039E5D1EC
MSTSVPPRHAASTFEIHLKQHLLYPTVSADISEWLPGESLADIMRRADRALYQAKESGRNRICFEVYA